MAFLKALFLICLIFSFASCSSVSYLVQGGLGQFALYNRERPIQEVIEDPRTPEKTKEQLLWVQEIKKIVESELGVLATSNYSTYVNLKRPYVIWAITVAEPKELKLKTWSFPIFGEFPYLGFFSNKDAQDWVSSYQKQGYDTYVRGVSAYSTLGYLRDPILSSMLTGRKSDLVNLIFHESTHAHIYIKNQGSFNEQLASFIGDQGERAWIEKEYGVHSSQMQEWEQRRMARRRFGVRLRQFSKKLKKFYAENSALKDSEFQKQKQALFSSFQKRLETDEKNHSYAKHAKNLTNNAALLSFLTYEDEQDVFDDLFRTCDKNLPTTFGYLKDFSRKYASSDLNRLNVSPIEVLKQCVAGERKIAGLDLSNQVLQEICN